MTAPHLDRLSLLASASVAVFLGMAIGCGTKSTIPGATTGASSGGSSGGTSTGSGQVDSPNAGTLVAAAPGTPDGPVAQAVIGPSGGEIRLEDQRVRLDIPAGALSTNTTISLLPITSTAPGAIGQAVRINADPAVTFSAPLTLSFSLGVTESAGVETASLGVATLNGQGYYEKQNATYDPNKRTLSTQLTHFSDWSALAGRQLIPGAASVQTGKTVALSVRWCEEVPADQRPTCRVGANQTCLVAECRRTSLPGSLFSNWAVNGREGGSTQTGTVSPSGASGTFTAPSQKPTPDTVAVSVRLSNASDNGFSLLTSNITITDQVEYRGDLYFGGLLGGTYSGYASLIFRQFENLPDVARYEVVSGTFTVTVKLPDCDPVYDVPIPAATGQNEGVLVVFNQSSAGGQVHFWNAGSQTIDVPVRCGDPRETLQYPITVNISPEERAYEDPLHIFGKERPLQGGGGVAWFFDRVK